MVQPCVAMKILQCNEGTATNQSRSGSEGHRFETWRHPGFSLRHVLTLKSTHPLLIFIHNLNSCVRCIGWQYICFTGERCYVSSTNKRSIRVAATFIIVFKWIEVSRRKFYLRQRRRTGGPRGRQTRSWRGRCCPAAPRPAAGRQPRLPIPPGLPSCWKWRPGFSYLGKTKTNFFLTLKADSSLRSGFQCSAFLLIGFINWGLSYELLDSLGCQYQASKLLDDVGKFMLGKPPLPGSLSYQYFFNPNHA